MLSFRCFALVLFSLVLLHVGAEGRHTLETRAIVTCETVLSNEVCQTLRDLATNLKLTADVIDEAVRDVVKRGITSVPQVITGVRAYLKDLIKNKVCEDLLSKDICARIHKVTDTLKIGRDAIKNIIHEVVVMGLPTPLKIYRKVMEKVRALIKSKTCEDFLAPEICKKLRDIATGLKTDVKLVEEFVKAAIIDGFQRREEIYNAVIEYFKERVLSVRCETLINGKICGFLKALARNLKLKVILVDSAVKDAILFGKITTQAIVDYVHNFLKTKIMAMKCDDYIPSVICNRLRSIARRLKVRAELVDQFVKDALIKGKTTISGISGFVCNMIKESIKCETWLGDSICGLIRRIAKRLGVGLAEVDQRLKDIVSAGKTTATDIFKEIIKFIKSKVFG